MASLVNVEIPVSALPPREPSKGAIVTEDGRTLMWFEGERDGLLHITDGYHVRDFPLMPFRPLPSAKE